MDLLLYVLKQSTYNTHDSHNCRVGLFLRIYTANGIDVFDLLLSMKWIVRVKHRVKRAKAGIKYPALSAQQPGRIHSLGQLTTFPS